MEAVTRLLAPLLIALMVSPPALAANPGLLREPTQSELAGVVEKTAAYFAKRKTAADLLNGSATELKLDAPTLAYFQSRLSGQKEPLPKLARKGTDLTFAHSSLPLTLKFAALGEGRIEVNNTPIAIEPLSAEALAARIQAALPRESASRFSLIPEAQAGWALAAVIIAFAAVVGISFWNDLKVYHATKGCQWALGQPVLVRGPKNAKEREEYQQFYDEFRKLETVGDPHDLRIVGSYEGTHEYVSCMKALRRQLDKFAPTATKPDAGKRTAPAE